MSGAPPRYADVPTPSRMDESVTNDLLPRVSACDCNNGAEVEY